MNHKVQGVGELAEIADPPFDLKPDFEEKNE